MSTGLKTCEPPIVETEAKHKAKTFFNTGNTYFTSTGSDLKSYFSIKRKKQIQNTSSLHFACIEAEIAALS